MPLFLMVMRSAVIIVSHISERNNDYVASARSGVCEQYYCELYAARPQYKQQPAKWLLFLFMASMQ